MIHEFKNGHWVPGDARRDGSQPFPKQPKPGLRFNDVTGAQGATEQAVVQPFADLLMQQVAMADLMPRPLDWPGFMARLEAAEAQVADETREFGRAWVQADESLYVQPAAGWDRRLVDEAAGLALALVRANGQLDFVRRQDWFRSGSHRLVLVLERQFARSTDTPVFHQDTDGTALFSNLMFRNEAGLPAPEWTPNLEPMPSGKRTRVGRQWPAGLLALIDTQRQQLAAAAPPLRIHGGSLPANACVSWIDELVWHSTPWLAHRPVYERSEVLAAMENDTFGLVALDVLMQIVQTPGSHLAALLAAQGVRVADFNAARAEDLWSRYHDDDADARALTAALHQDIDAIDWRQRKAYTGSAMSLIRDLPEGGQHITVQPSGMGGRPRSNSENLDALTSDPAAFQLRHFMQVVVSVVPAH